MGIVVSSALFAESVEPVLTPVEYFKVTTSPTEDGDGEPQIIRESLGTVRYNIMPLTAELRTEYQKRRGHGVQEFEVSTPELGQKGSVRPVKYKVDSERETAARQWLASKVITGWVAEDIRDSEGNPIEFSGKMLKILAADRAIIIPVFDACSKLGEIKVEAEVGN